eukprot:scaffold24521_cov121-Skeletonema_dohrnii-CCMP3373.AAC.2
MEATRDGKQIHGVSIAKYISLAFLLSSSSSPFHIFFVYKDSQVDGVMGGKSSGDLTFLESNTVMSFSGVISLDGGGFSSVRKSFSSAIDLSPYAGFVVELETTSAHDPNNVDAPLGLHLQFHDSNTRYIGYASAFAVPLSSDIGEAVSVYLPQTSFDRGSWIGRPCNDCQINFSSIVEMDIYVLFQEGPFEVKVKKVTAVDDHQSFPSPAIALSSTEEIKTLIDQTIQSGGGLYDDGYQELCIAIYTSILNTILSANDSGATSSIVSDRMKNIICSGLQRAETQIGSKANMAWTLRYTLDALLEEMGFTVTSNEQAWRPDPTMNEYQCSGVTTGAYIMQVSNEPTKSPINTTAQPTLSPSLVTFKQPTSSAPLTASPAAGVPVTQPPPTLSPTSSQSTSTPSLSAFNPLQKENSEAPDNEDNANAEVSSFANTNDVSTSEITTSSASFPSIPFVLIVTAVILAAYCDGFSTSYPARKSHRCRLHNDSTQLLSASQSNEQQQPQMNGPSSIITPPPPELNRVPLPAMLAGGLFLFATSVPSSQRSRADKLLRLAQEALRSDPVVTMELGPGIEAGNVYASSKGTVGNVDQLVLQFQINGGNAWAQGITYGVEDENGLRLVALEVANMDAVLNNQSFQVPLT